MIKPTRKKLSFATLTIFVVLQTSPVASQYQCIYTPYGTVTTNEDGLTITVPPTDHEIAEDMYDRTFGENGAYTKDENK